MKVRMPAEWERQSAVMLSFPRRKGDWGGFLAETARQHLELVITIAEATPVLLLVADEILLQDTLRSCPEFALDFIEASKINGSNKLAPPELSGKILVNPVRIVFIPLNDVWARDFGPITVVQAGKPVLLDFKFNGWGNKFKAKNDNLVTRRLDQMGCFGDISIATVKMVLEGGSIESDGAGTILTTSHCLLNKNRNPKLTREKIDAALQKHLGAERILYLDHGHLIGDDTDGHIDTLARFVAEDTIVYQACDDPDDEHYTAFQHMKTQLEGFRMANGDPYKLVPLPWHPLTCSKEDGRRLPGSYANFLITNDIIVVPGSGKPEDQQVVKIMEELFPVYRILLVDAWYFLEQHGSVHCLTMPFFA